MQIKGCVLLFALLMLATTMSTATVLYTMLVRSSNFDACYKQLDIIICMCIASAAITIASLILLLLASRPDDVDDHDDILPVRR